MTLIHDLPGLRVTATLVLLLACGPHSNIDSASSTGDSTTTITTTTITTTNTTTTNTTNTTTTDPTTGPNSTSSPPTSSDPSTSGVPQDMGVPFCGDNVCQRGAQEDCTTCPDDCGGCALPEGLSGCLPGWTGGSAVVGMTSFGPFTGQTAFFGWAGVGNSAWSELRIFVYDASVDLEAAKQFAYSSNFFALQLSPTWNQPDWVNQGVVPGVITHDGTESGHQTLLEISGTTGNWQQFDPMDPPRLLGMIHPADPKDAQALEGPFDAVYCDPFVQQVHVE